MPSPPHWVMFLTEPLQLVIFIIVAIECLNPLLSKSSSSMFVESE